MSIVFLLPILAAFLWATTNHIDKFLVSDVDKSSNNIKTLLVFSTLVAGLIFSPIWLIISGFSVGISTLSLIAVFASTAFYVLGTYFYLKALAICDASVVVVMFQMIPVFTYFLALFLFGENLSLPQIFGSIIILASAIIISLDFEKKKHSRKLKALLLMLLASLVYAVFFVLFDVGIRDSSYNACAFWMQISYATIGVFLICLKSFRRTFVKAVKNNGKLYFTLNATNELLNLLAELLVNFANVSIPIALANILTGFQGAFVFILGVLGIKFLPKFFKENLSKKVILQKVGCIILSLIGLAVMFLL